jgi:hypothetical protein
MATSSNLSLSGVQNINALLDLTRWDPVSGVVNLTYNFPTAASYYPSNYFTAVDSSVSSGGGAAGYTFPISGSFVEASQAMKDAYAVIPAGTTARPRSSRIERARRRGTRHPDRNATPAVRGLEGSEPAAHRWARAMPACVC